MMKWVAIFLLVSLVHGRELLKPDDKKCGNGCVGECVGNCCSSTGECPSSSCPANDLGSNLVNCNKNTCLGWSCNKSAFNETCTGSDSHCLGRVYCDSCSFKNEVCFYDGVSDNFKVCGEASDPVDCIPSAWGPWGPCVSGNQTRERTVETPAQNGGKECDVFTETKKCSNPLLNDSGCGPQLYIYNCKLDTTLPETECTLPFGLGVIKVPTLPGYTRMRFRINARGEYKPT